MNPRPAGARFGDVLQAARYAETIVARGRSSFDADVTLRLAGERVIEMLAEAVAAAADELAEAYPDYPWHEPVGMRNLLAHEYWRADPDLIWTTLVEDVPEVATMVRDVQSRRGPGDQSGC